MNNAQALPSTIAFGARTICFTVLIGLLTWGSLAAQTPSSTSQANDPIRAVLAKPEQVSDRSLLQWQKQRFDVVIWIEQVDRETLAAVKKTAAHSGNVDYFFEVARCPELAKKHPEWMASIQGHHEWMRLFDGFDKPQKDEVVKVYPWVPVFNREPFDAQVKRIQTMLAELPTPRRVWLNNVQGAPSACGCGHPLCRWTADYGPLKTATPIGDAAPAEFVEKIQSIVGNADVIPIMTSECEADDQHSVCGGVGCFEGACWKAFTKQLDLVAKKTKRVGVACFYKEFNRDLKRYGVKANWIRTAMLSFEKMPRIRNGKGLKTDRLIAVIQGWDVTHDELKQQQKIADALNPAGTLLCLPKVDQSWTPKTMQPKLADVKPKERTGHNHD